LPVVAWPVASIYRRFTGASRGETHTATRRGDVGGRS
jgi:hypothetical protein